MNKFLTWFFRIVAVLSVIALIAMISIYFVLKRSIPDYDYREPVYTKGYQAEILRDRQAVPHIYGETEKDALFALGFAHAQDRLWQMETSRRAVQGRLSELFGEETLAIDIYFRALDMWNLADRAAKTLPEDELELLQAYSDGVNAYIKDININKRGSGSPEFLIFGRAISPWTPTDSMALVKLMASELTSSAQEEILRAKLANTLSPDQMRDLFYDIKLPANFDQLSYNGTPSSFNPSPLAQAVNPIKPASSAGASNAFAVSSARSASRMTVLANDPHLELTAPTIWMLAHIKFKDDGLDIFGGTIPGIPSVIIGHNQNLSWGLTTSYLDDQDLVVLKRNGAGFEINGQVLPLQSELLNIAVKGREEPYSFRREYSPYGPIIPFGGPLKVEEIVPEGHAVALSWTALMEDDHSISSALNVMRAKNVQQAMRALQNFVAPSQIFTLADKNGNIAQFAAGALPLRSTNNPSKGTLPVPSWLGEAGFTGIIPFSENPKLVNPKDGLIIHTNNKFIDKAYPYHFSYDWGDVYRRLRAEELLGRRKYHTISSFAEAQNDEISDAARVLLPLMAREFWFRPELKENHAAILEMLANWNGEYDALRPEPLIFSAWLEELNYMIFSDELGALYFDLGRVDPLRLERIFRNVEGSARWCDIRPTPETENCAMVSQAAFERSIAKLSKTYGSGFSEWRWGRAHHAVHKNRFLSEIPVLGSLTNIVQEQSGDTQTLLRLSYPGHKAPQSAGELTYDFDSNHGAGLRMLVDFSDLDHSQIIIATGQSGHVLSPHYDDLSTLWRAGEYVQMNTDRRVIDGNLAGRIKFIPESLKDSEPQY